MPIKPTDIWPDTHDFPSREDIHCYVNGKMEKKEQHRFEKQMAASELLADAVEGLMQERDKNQESIIEINSLIDNKIRSLRKVASVFSHRNLAIAASVVLILMLGVLYRFILKEENINGPIQIAMSPIIASDTLLKSNESTVISSSGNRPQDQVIAYNPVRKNALKPMPKTTDEDLKIEALASSPPIAADQTDMNIVESEEVARNMVLDTLNENNHTATEMLAYLPEKKEPIEDNPVILNETVTRKELKKSKALKGDYSPASGAKMAERTLETNKANRKPELWNEKILVLIEQNNMALAVKELEMIIALNDYRKETAIWLKSACLLKLNRIEEAKVMLKDLAYSNSIYKEKAENVLKELR